MFSEHILIPDIISKNYDNAVFILLEEFCLLFKYFSIISGQILIPDVISKNCDNAVSFLF